MTTFSKLWCGKKIEYLALMLIFGGCGTIRNVINNPTIYGGIRHDLHVLDGTHNKPPTIHMTPNGHLYEIGCHTSTSSLVKIAYGLDLPFSFLCDTICLVYTVPRETLMRKHPWNEWWYCRE